MTRSCTHTIYFTDGTTIEIVSNRSDPRCNDDLIVIPVKNGAINIRWSAVKYATSFWETV